MPVWLFRCCWCVLRCTLVRVTLRVWLRLRLLHVDCCCSVTRLLPTFYTVAILVHGYAATLPAGCLLQDHTVGSSSAVGWIPPLPPPPRRLLHLTPLLLPRSYYQFPTVGLRYYHLHGSATFAVRLVPGYGCSRYTLVTHTAFRLRTVPAWLVTVYAPHIRLRLRFVYCGCHYTHCHLPHVYGSPALLRTFTRLFTFCGLRTPLRLGYHTLVAVCYARLLRSLRFYGLLVACGCICRCRFTFAVYPVTFAHSRFTFTVGLHLRVYAHVYTYGCWLLHTLRVCTFGYALPRTRLPHARFTTHALRPDYVTTGYTFHTHAFLPFGSPRLRCYPCVTVTVWLYYAVGYVYRFGWLPVTFTRLRLFCAFVRSAFTVTVG